ncbi:hypothetical protein P4S72_26790 [Vibrio sp. PP-XX7]
MSSDGKRYDLSWSLAAQNDSEFFRLQATEHYLAWELVQRAMEHELPPVHLTFHYDQLVGNYSALQELIGQSGKLMCYRTRFLIQQQQDQTEKNNGIGDYRSAATVRPEER